MSANQKTIKISHPPFSNTTNELLYGILTGLVCHKYETLVVDDTGVVVLNPVANVTFIALIVIEADPTISEAKRAIRFTEDLDNPPTPIAGTDEGFPLGDMSIYEVKGWENIAQFQMIGREAGKTHKVRVQYYG